MRDLHEQKEEPKKTKTSKKSINLTEPILPLLPLKNVVLLPRNIIPIIVGRASSIAAVEYALKHDGSLFVTAQKKQDTEVPDIRDVFEWGTRAKILQVMRIAKGSLKILVEGINRAVVESHEQRENFLCVTVRDVFSVDLEAKDTTEIFALLRHLQGLYNAYAIANPKAPVDMLASAKTLDDIDSVSDTLGMRLNLSFDEHQELLETLNLSERLVKLCGYMRRELDILETEERIRGRVQGQVEKNQREYYLTEQLKAIQKELGRDDQAGELVELRKKIDELKLPAVALEKVEREFKRLEQMPPLSSEAVISRHYIDWVISIPWHAMSKDTISLVKAEEILNKYHAGLKNVKERIIEFLAAKKFSSNLERSPILCLVGPPGVGKTSLAKSIADSLGREFVRISLGGIRDEAEIRGHRRTYIGALPGKIIQGMRKVKTTNPVFLLDEIDKISHDIHGDPASALLEVLDPEQNKNFTDHFLETEYDLSKVMFIATANHIDGIPFPLYDRMEIITLSGYTEVEKKLIAEQFLIPKNLHEYSLTQNQFNLSSVLLEKIITSYTKEAGVRQLERVIAKLMRKVIQELLKNSPDESQGTVLKSRVKTKKKNSSEDNTLESASNFLNSKPVDITDEKIFEWLGYPKFKKTSLSQEKQRIGLATGLAWTELGGDILEIETTVLPGKAGLTLTGQLGEVMQESAQAALSYIRSRAKELGLKKSFYANSDIHVHIPEGATPKDGPSAGITMCTALVSALTKNPTRADLAMTGEITLRGRILGVGGLKEKLLAAKQYGLKTVLVAAENKDDIEECKKDLGDGLEIIYVETMDQVLTHALVNKPFNKLVGKSVGKTKK